MSENKKYFIQQFLQEKYNHGGVGPSHAEEILKRNGYEPVFFPGHSSHTILAKVKRLLFLIRVFNRIQSGSVVVIIFPVYARMSKILMKWLLRKRGVRCICYLADIDGIKDASAEKLKEEKAILSEFTYFIVHNERMKTWVCENISENAKTVQLEFFDFLAKPAQNHPVLSKEIVFAGNLQKSEFLRNLPLIITAQPALRFNLYGPGMFEMDESFGSIIHHGVFSPTELPAKLVGSFGLVWDGDSVERPSGILGHYLQFITHHKVSLYILAGLPILVPSSAGSASLVLKYGIGVVVDSLFDLDSTINSISEAEYQTMQENMRPLAEKISSGRCLEDALRELGN